MTSPTICLNMIVKNEEKIIERLLESALPIIDTYCICDTGSTDNTIKVITDFFDKHGIKGKIVQKPFVNFGVNRTFALHAAKGMADYALLLDADMLLKIGPKFDKKYLTKDVYQILQKAGSLVYYNTRILSLKLNVTVKCPTHEYYDIHQDHTKENVGDHFLYIDDVGDGGSKADKFPRDIKLLLEGIKEEPDNPRYYFYLGNSYYNTGKNEEAIPHYKKRIELGGWVEEVFYSHLKLGHCYQNLGNEPQMLYHFVQGYQVRPCRAETLYELVKHYRIKGEHYKAYLFYEVAKQIPFPLNDLLFIDNDTYTYKLLYEFSIIAYYIGKTNISDTFFELFRKMPIHGLYPLLGNYKFYKYILPNPVKTICFNNQIENIVNNKKLKFVASTPSIIKYKDGYGINQRYVTYTITPKGSYEFEYDSTINQFIQTDIAFDKIDTVILKDLENDPHRYAIQDVKLLNVNDTILYTGTCKRENGKIGVGGGKYLVNGDSFDHHVYTMENMNDCEKNWVYLPTQDIDDLKMVYKWHPLTIGKLINNKLVVEKKIDMPNLFSLARGSTNGFAFGNEIWFIVHYVHVNNGSPRDYYHGIVVLNNNDYTLKAYTKPFKFTDNPVEYCCGLIVTDHSFIVSHSVMDRESYVKIYDKLCISEMLHYV